MTENKWTPEEESMIDALEREYYEKLRNSEYDGEMDFGAAYHELWKRRRRRDVFLQFLAFINALMIFYLYRVEIFDFIKEVVLR